jgi:hydrogenase maturation protease
MDKKSDQDPAKILVLGYGNVDRQDDGVAWHILQQLSGGLSLPVAMDEQELPSDQSVHLFYQLQLTPELAEVLANYNRIIFVDAHTGAVPLEIQVTEIQNTFQHSPLTHHLTPSSCLSLVEFLYGCTVQGFLVSIRGYEFGFARALSPQTERLAGRAVQVVNDIINSPIKTDTEETE